MVAPQQSANVPAGADALAKVWSLGAKKWRRRRNMANNDCPYTAAFAMVQARLGGGKRSERSLMGKYESSV